MSTDPAQGDAAAYCTDAVRSHDFERYASALFVAPTRRRALLALYAFAAEIAHVRDHVTQPLPGEIRLQWWTDALGGIGHGGVEGHPIAAELLEAVSTYGLPVADLVRMVEAHHFDLYDDPMPTQDALEHHLEDTSGVQFALAARICGVEADAALVRHAGLAQGVARVIARLPVHAARRQLYLPQQLLDLNGAQNVDVFNGTATAELRRVLAVLGHEALVHVDTALQGLARLPVEARLAFLPLVTTRRALQHFARPDFDPFRQPPPSRLATLWSLWHGARKAPFKV